MVIERATPSILFGINPTTYIYRETYLSLASVTPVEPFWCSISLSLRSKPWVDLFDEKYCEMRIHQNDITVCIQFPQPMLLLCEYLHVPLQPNGLRIFSHAFLLGYQFRELRIESWEYCFQRECESGCGKKIGGMDSAWVVFLQTMQTTTKRRLLNLQRRKDDCCCWMGVWVGGM